MKDSTFIIPSELKRRRKIVKFSYISLRNLIYYIEKGIRTQGKITRDFHDSTLNEFIKNYFNCHKEHKTLKDEECKLIHETLIKYCFSQNRQILIPKEDYFLKLEKELMFKRFAFYCNVFIESSYHINNDKFNKSFIIEIIDELSKKLMINVNNEFKDFISNDILEILENI